MSAFRYLSVCSGIEAATVAWKPLGWECAGVSEIEPFPRAVLQHRLGAVPVEFDDHRWREGSNTIPLFGDFTRIESHHVGPVDLLVGGTPCQSFSIAGKRLGLDDPRGNLTLEFLALAQRVRPTWLVWENVAGILSHDEGRTLGTFLRLVGECGFRWAYRVLDAQYCRVGRFGRAVPQRRRRVFLVGYSGTADLDPAAVLFDRESLRGNPAPRREAGERPAPTLAARTRGGGGLGTDFDLDGGLTPIWPADVAPTLNAAFGSKLGLEDQHIRGGVDGLSPPVANCLTVRMHKGINTTLDEGQTLIPTPGGGFDDAQVAHSLRPEGFDASEDGTGRGTPIVPVSYAIQERAVSENPAAGPQGKGWQEGHAFTLEARNKVQAVAFTAKDHGGVAAVECSPTLRAGGHAGSHANAGVMPAVAFAQNSRDEVRVQGDGLISGSLAADEGMKQRTYLAASWGVRRLTPTECARLMGFPDDWTRIPWRGKPAEQCPDGPQYRAYGNSMAANCMIFIGERIEAVRGLAQ